MAVFESKLNVNSDSFAQNRVNQLKNIELMETLRERTAQASEKRRPRFEERNQLTPSRQARLFARPRNAIC